MKVLLQTFSNTSAPYELTIPKIGFYKVRISLYYTKKDKNLFQYKIQNTISCGIT